MSASLILLVIAFVLFVIEAIGVASRVNLTALGLACLTGSFIAAGLA